MSQLITRAYAGKTFLFREDGYINMTKTAKEFGKRIDDFLVNKATTEYMEALANTGNVRDLLKTKRGHNGGTWGHPKLAVFFARWLDVKFAVFCDMVIDDILNKKAELVITKPEESAVMKLPQTYLEAVLELGESLKAQELLKQQKEALQHKVDHLTIRQFEVDMGIYPSKPQKNRMAHFARNYCLAMDLPIGKVPMTLQDDYGNRIDSFTNVYPRKALEHAADLLGMGGN